MYIQYWKLVAWQNTHLQFVKQEREKKENTFYKILEDDHVLIFVFFNVLKRGK